jgi:hypothetical protein
MVNVVQYNVDFYGCGLRDLVPLVGSLSVLVTVRVYTGGPSAVVFLLGYILVVWFVHIILYDINHSPIDKTVLSIIT